MQVQPQETSFAGEASGQMSLSNAHVMVIRNLFGGVLVAGEGRTDSFRWYLYKTVTVESSADTAGLFSLINLSVTTNGDTIYLEIADDTPLQIKTSCSIQLGIPYNMICKIEQVRGNSEISDLDSLLLINNASGVNVLRHNGSCQITSGTGNISVETAFTNNGFCKVKVDNGDINLKVPVNISAMVYAKTGFGSVSYSGLTLANVQQQEKQLSGILGSGAGNIQLESNQGNIKLQAIP